jgi:hypothetical protein
VSSGLQAFTDPSGTVCSPGWLAVPRHLTVTSPKIPCSWPLPGDHRQMKANRVPTACGQAPPAFGNKALDMMQRIE